MTEKEILAKIKEKESIIEKTNEDIQVLRNDIYLIYKEKILSKFKIGDILVCSFKNKSFVDNATFIDKRIFKLECFDSAGLYGYARTQHIMYGKVIKHFKVYPQPVVRLDLLLEHGRKANENEIKRFEEAFKE